MTVNRGILALFGVLAFFGTVSVAKEVIVSPCPGTSAPVPNFVDVKPCPSQPCIFPKGVTVNAAINFTPREEVTSGKLEVAGIFEHVRIPFPLPKSEVCSGFGLKCPLKPNVAEELSLSFPILKVYPSVQLVATFGLKDQDSKYVFCFALPVKIGE